MLQQSDPRTEGRNSTESCPAVAIVPYRKWPITGISKLNLDALDWPLGRPARLKSGVVGDMGSQDHLITFPRKVLFYTPWFGVKAQVSVMIVEPDAIHGHHIRSAYKFRRRFNYILTKNRDLLEKIDNGIFFTPGSTFIEHASEIDRTKTRMISLIASEKNQLPGHRMRHDIVEFIRENDLEVEVMGRGYKPFADKADGLAPYRFSVIIENSREPSYFTEKLVDAFLCDTVPVYWGGPDIGEFFRTDGMIICDAAEDIQNALLGLDIDAYERRLGAIIENRERAFSYADSHKRAATAVSDSVLQQCGAK